MFEDLTVVTPVKETKSLLDWYERMKWLFSEACWIVVDSGGGAELSSIADLYIKSVFSEWEARELGISKVETSLTLNLDCFNILPEQYVKSAVDLLTNNRADVTAIDYEESIGHYGFGTSIWRTDILREVYDYPPKPLEIKLKDEKGESHIYKHSICECQWMWNRVYSLKKRFVPLLFKAKNNGEQHG